MIISSFATKRLSAPELSVGETIDMIFSPTNVYSSQYIGFYHNMRNWLEKAKYEEPFIKSICYIKYSFYF